MEKRIVICKKCGKEFEVIATAMKAKYCIDCREIVRVEYYKNYNRANAENKHVTSDLVPGTNEWLESHPWILKYSPDKDLRPGSRFCKLDVDITSKLGYFKPGTEFINKRSGNMYRVVECNRRKKTDAISKLVLVEN